MALFFIYTINIKKQDMKKITLSIATAAMVTLLSSCHFWAGVSGKKHSASVGAGTSLMVTPPANNKEQVNSPVGMK